MNGIFTPTEGKATLLGINPAKPTRHLHEGFGYLPQLFVLYKNLSVYENLDFMAAVHGLGWRERRGRIKAQLEFVEMWGSRKTLAGNISGGMQRRLELAASLIHNPKLLFADEPTAGIDPVLRGKFWDEFRRLREVGHTLFVTTQYVGESEYCDRVGVIRKGKLVALGTPLELRRSAMGGDLLDISSFHPLGGELVNRLVQMPFVVKNEGKPLLRWISYPNELRLNVVDAGEAIPQIMPILQEANVAVKELQEYRPSFDEVFITLMGSSEAD
jgi:ABC-2 type transport system ATP-binding protein